MLYDADLSTFLLLCYMMQTSQQSYDANLLTAFLLCYAMVVCRLYDTAGSLAQQGVWSGFSYPDPLAIQTHW